MNQFQIITLSYVTKNKLQTQYLSLNFTTQVTEMGFEDYSQCGDVTTMSWIAFELHHIEPLLMWLP